MCSNLNTALIALSSDESSSESDGETVASSSASTVASSSASTDEGVQLHNMIV